MSERTEAATTDWVDLNERLHGAERTLRQMAADALDAGDLPNAERLVAKVEGVALAISYMNDYASGEADHG